MSIAAEDCEEFKAPESAELASVPVAVWPVVGLGPLLAVATGAGFPGDAVGAGAGCDGLDGLDGLDGHDGPEALGALTAPVAVVELAPSIGSVGSAGVAWLAGGLAPPLAEALAGATPAPPGVEPAAARTDAAPDPEPADTEGLGARSAPVVPVVPVAPVVSVAPAPPSTSVAGVALTPAGLVAAAALAAGAPA